MSATSRRCRACLSGSDDPQLWRRTRNDDDALEHAAATASRWIHPVTNIRNTSSPHWRAWLSAENRCLVPANSFAEYAPEPNPEPKKKDVVWFALSDDRPLFAFAGMWMTFNGDHGTKSKPVSGPHQSMKGHYNDAASLRRVKFAEERY